MFHEVCAISPSNMPAKFSASVSMGSYETTKQGNNIGKISNMKPIVVKLSK